MIGDEASVLYPFGEVFIDLDGAVNDLLADKELKKTQLLNPHAASFTTSPIIQTEEALQNFIEDMVNAYYFCRVVCWIFNFGS